MGDNSQVNCQVLLVRLPASVSVVDFACGMPAKTHMHGPSEVDGLAAKQRNRRCELYAK